MPSQIVNDVVGADVARAAVLGPSFAKDLMAHDLTAVNVASHDQNLSSELMGFLRTRYLRGYATDDLLGTQLCAALKNVVALGVGMFQGAGFSDNGRAALITLALEEIKTAVAACGGQEKTIYGLAGLGDLLLTATGKSSRNLEVGRRFGAGQSLDKILLETGYIPEAINTVKAIPPLEKKIAHSLPILHAFYTIVYDNAPLASLIELL